MAIYLKNCKPILPFAVCCCVRGSIFTSTHRQNSSIVTLDGTDALDKFTTNLVETKMEKWNNVRKNIFKSINKNNSLDTLSRDNNYNIKDFNIDQINVLFESLLEQNDTSGIICLINECVKHKKRPSHNMILKVFCTCSSLGDIKTILQMRTLCEPQMLQKYSHFEHHIAEANWRKGNLNASTQLFFKVYKENELLRKTIILMIKYLIDDIMCNSEGALLAVIKFCEQLSKDFGENLPLFFVWRTSFASEWYSDQCIAAELLEKHEVLQKIIVDRLHYIVTTALMKHQSEVVYRLLEYLLKKNLMDEYAKVVLPLLNYKIHQRDLRSCKEILHWCEQYNIQLPLVWQESYLNLLLRFDVSIPKSQPNNLHRTTFNMKF